MTSKALDLTLVECLIGKANEIYTQLTIEQSSCYDTVKELILKAYNVIESVAEGFPTYSCISELLCLCFVEILKSLPVHSFNALILPVLGDCFTQIFVSKVLASKLPRQGYRYHKLRKAFSKCYRRHVDLVSKYNVGLKHFFCKVFLNLNFMAT